MARDFKKIIAWQKADDLVVEVYRITKAFFPSDERFGMTSQIQRAVVSVPANIAEGSGRDTLKDFLRFLHLAQGSLSEVEYYLHLAKRLSYMNEENYLKLEEQRAEVGRLLYGLIRSIRGKVNNGERT